jgi:hypothetical protein
MYLPANTLSVANVPENLKMPDGRPQRPRLRTSVFTFKRGAGQIWDDKGPSFFDNQGRTKLCAVLGGLKRFAGASLQSLAIARPQKPNTSPP